MKLNPDCIRDTLLKIEDFPFLSDDLALRRMEGKDFYSLNEKYSTQDVVYTLIKLEEANLIKASIQFAGGKLFSLSISALTFPGHEYLSKIKDQEKWNKVKTIGSKVEDFSLSAIEKIAEGVTNAAIDKFFKST